MDDGWRRAKQAAFSAATGAYAAVLVVATHYPSPEQILGDSPPPDKLLHLVAYAILGGLAAAASIRTPLTWTRAAVLAAGLVVFAMLDEVTQPLFRRHADVADLAFDCVGIAIGIALVAIANWAWARGSR
jgi:VanZ family protein